jgi:hypothetical protein
VRERIFLESHPFFIEEGLSLAELQVFVPIFLAISEDPAIHRGSLPAC